VCVPTPHTVVNTPAIPASLMFSAWLVTRPALEHEYLNAVLVELISHLFTAKRKPSKRHSAAMLGVFLLYYLCG
jgi:hypothetical protein